jgi:hypothetical protein
MNEVERILKFLEGKKTYLAACGLLVVAYFQYKEGKVDQAIQSLMAALAAFGLRQAIDKSQDKVADKVADKVVNQTPPVDNSVSK